MFGAFLATLKVPSNSAIWPARTFSFEIYLISIYRWSSPQRKRLNNERYQKCVGVICRFWMLFPSKRVRKSWSPPNCRPKTVLQEVAGEAHHLSARKLLLKISRSPSFPLSIYNHLILLCKTPKDRTSTCHLISITTSIMSTLDSNPKRLLHPGGIPSPNDHHLGSTLW